MCGKYEEDKVTRRDATPATDKMPSPAPPSRGLLPPLPKPKPALPAAKAIFQSHAQAQNRARAQPVALARSNRHDAPLSAGFVQLLNAGHAQEADSEGRKGEFYDPKPGDFAVGVVVSGTEARLDVAVGSDRLATLLAKELHPLDRRGADRLEQATPPRPGSVGVVAGPAMGEEETRKLKHWSRALVAPGTVVFAEVLGRTLSGRPLLSARRLFRRLAWHRARQV
jgi:small subunit ribosomal protein S1